MKNKFLIIGCAVGCIALLGRAHAVTFEDFNFESVPKAGSFSVETIEGKNPNETADLICVSKEGEIQLAQGTISTNMFGKLQNPLQITPETCGYEYYTFKLKSADGERILKPFVCMIQPPTEEKGAGIPHIIELKTETTEDPARVKFVIISSTSERYFVSGDVVEAGEWKEFTNSPIEVELKNPEGANTVYITFANGNLMKTLVVNLEPRMQEDLEKRISETLSEKEAEIYAKLLTGSELSGEEMQIILNDSESMKRYFDPDGDGLTTDQEIRLGTDPEVSDSDGDGKSDGEETLILGTDPLRFDETFDIKFANIEEDATLQKDSSVITGFGFGNTKTKISFIDPDTNETAGEMEVMTNSEGVFKIQTPAELENKAYTIIAEQEGVKTTIAKVNFGAGDDSLGFTLDAINEMEIPVQVKKRVEIKTQKNKPVTLYGSISSDIVTEDMKITAYVTDESNNKISASAFSIPEGGMGLFAITLPELAEGNYEITLQSSGENTLGPSTRVPVEIRWTENGKFTVHSRSELSIPTLIFMLFVGTLSIYAFFFYRRDRN